MIAALDHETPAADQTAWRHFLLDPKVLLRGKNLLAVELHQASPTGTDMNFDAQLSGTIGSKAPPLFIRAAPGGYDLSWPAAFEGWTLQTSPSVSPGTWSTLSLPLKSLDGWIYTTHAPPAGNAPRYYRLLGP